jgi:hypothetical protein
MAQKMAEKARAGNDARDNLARVTQNVETANASVPFMQQFGSPEMSQALHTLIKTNPQVGLGMLGNYMGLADQSRARKQAEQSPYAQAQLEGQQLSNEQARTLGPLQIEALRANIDQSRAATMASQQTGVAGVNTAYSNVAGKLRQDFTASQPVADFVDTWQSAQQLRASLEADSAVGAQGAIIKLARIYDPGGVVREGEAQVYRGSFGALQALQNTVKAAKGKGFDVQTRQDIQALADDVLMSSLPAVQQIQDQYAGMSIRQGVDPRDVLVTPIPQADLADLQKRVNLRKGIVDYSDLPKGAKAKSGLVQRGP